MMPSENVALQAAVGDSFMFQISFICPQHRAALSNILFYELAIAVWFTSSENRWYWAHLSYYHGGARENGTILRKLASSKSG